MAKLIKTKKTKRIITRTKESTTTTTFPHLTSSKKQWNLVASKILKAKTKWLIISKFNKTSLRILNRKMSIQKTFNKILIINFQTIKIPASNLLQQNISLKNPKSILRDQAIIIQELNICKSKKTCMGKKKTTMILNKRKMIRIMEIIKILKIFRNQMLNLKILLTIIWYMIAN